jgi:anti-sigma regulatory factor (Ser/Thr protein kinase)
MMRIVLSSEPRLLHVLRAVVKFAAQEAGISQDNSGYVALAVDEAAANIIRHTYRGSEDERMALEIRRLPDRLEFLLEDWGPKVCEEKIRPRPLDELRPGGLGTFFIYAFMDECSYDPAFEQGNRLKMVKFLTGKGACFNDGSNAQSG